MQLPCNPDGDELIIQFKDNTCILNITLTQNKEKNFLNPELIYFKQSYFNNNLKNNLKKKLENIIYFIQKF